MKHIGGILWDAYLYALEKRFDKSNDEASTSADPRALMEEVRQEALEYLNAQGYSIGEDDSGFLTVCCECKKVRDGDNRWRSFEDYMAEHSRVEITHGLCEDCVKKLFEGRTPRRGSKSRPGGGTRRD
jgi:hypothetical protein